jgi:hypothetical protein
LPHLPGLLFTVRAALAPVYLLCPAPLCGRGEWEGQGENELVLVPRRGSGGEGWEGKWLWGLIRGGEKQGEGGRRREKAVQIVRGNSLFSTMEVWIQGGCERLQRGGL